MLLRVDEVDAEDDGDAAGPSKRTPGGPDVFVDSVSFNGGDSIGGSSGIGEEVISMGDGDLEVSAGGVDGSFALADGKFGGDGVLDLTGSGTIPKVAVGP